jgi:hypothetical protein
MTSSSPNVIRLTERDCELLRAAGLRLDKGNKVQDVYCFTLYPFQDGTMLQVLRLLEEVHNAAAFAAKFRTHNKPHILENDPKLIIQDDVSEVREGEFEDGTKSVDKKVLKKKRDYNKSAQQNEIRREDQQEEGVDSVEQDANVGKESREDPSNLLGLAWLGAQVTRTHLESVWSDILGLSSLVLVSEEPNEMQERVNPLPKRRENDEILVDNDSDLTYLTEDEEWEEDDDTGAQILTRSQRQEVLQQRKKRKLRSSISSISRGSTWGILPEWFE